MPPIPPQDSPASIGDYVELLSRQKVWIFGSIFAALVMSVAIAFLWPDTYVSVAAIRVVPPQVPENFVPANVNLDVQGRVSSLVQLILNRATLTNIINTHGLYRRKLARSPMDDVIEDMKRDDIRVVALPQSLNQAQGRNGQYPTLEIRFASSNRFTAQKVTTDLVARFLEENVREVSQRTVSTTQFLRDQWENSKKKLDALEQSLSVFRTQNMGHLPEEQQNNYQQLTALQAQKLNITMSMNRVSQEKLLDENQLGIYRGQLAAMKDPGMEQQAAGEKNERLTEKDREITQYETSLANARERYKETHPDIQRLISLLAAARKQREGIAIAQETSKPEPAIEPAASSQFLRERRDLEASLQKMQGLIQAKDLEMEDYRKQAVQLDATIKTYQARIQSIPVGIKEYDELIRDRDLAKKDYEDLDRRVNSSAMSTALENRQQGERLEQLDPPSLPQTPSEPNRPLIVAAGCGMGLIIGLFFAGVREARDTAMRNLKDLSVYTELPILGNIPLIETSGAVLRRKRRAWLAWSAACLLGILVMSTSIFYYLAKKV
jgi:succinoglycan biosynthesis transport protein ExoP